MRKMCSASKEKGFTRNGIAADRLSAAFLVNTSAINNPKPPGQKARIISNHTMHT